MPMEYLSLILSGLFIVHSSIVLIFIAPFSHQVESNLCNTHILIFNTKTFTWGHGSIYIQMYQSG